MVRSNSTLSLQPPITTDDLVLRICGSSRDGEVVRLRSTKCAIGSDSQCTLRLRARGVAPVHCLIVRGSRSTVIRRWSLDTRLNGHAFADAELAVGDRLSIGRIEFEVIELGQVSRAEHASETAASRPAPASDSDRSLPVAADRRPDAQPADNRWAEELASKQQSLAEQIEQLQRAIAQWKCEKIETEKHLGEQSEAVDARCAELEQESQALAEQRDRWLQEQSEAEERFERRKTELDARQAELERQQEELQQQQRRREEELDARQADLERLQEDFQQQQLRLEEERAEQSEHVASHEPLDDQIEIGPFAVSSDVEPDIEADIEADVEADIEAGGAADPDIGAESTVLPWQNAEGRSPSDEAPVSLDNVFAHAKDTKLIEEPPKPAEYEFDSADDLSDEQTLPIGRLDQTQEWVSDEKPDMAAEEGEESIDAYMERLLQRVGKRTDEPGQGPAQPADRSAQATHEQVPQETQEPQELSHDSSASIEPADALPAANSLRKTVAKMAPRTVAPEKLLDMSAMRRVANVSAQSALDEHALRMLVVDARVKVTVTTMGLTIGTLLLWGWWIGKVGWTGLLCAACSFLVALLWGFRYTLITRRIAIAKRGSADRRAADSAADSAATESPKDGDAPQHADTSQADDAPETMEVETAPSGEVLDGEAPSDGRSVEPMA